MSTGIRKWYEVPAVYATEAAAPYAAPLRTSMVPVGPKRMMVARFARGSDQPDLIKPVPSLHI